MKSLKHYINEKLVIFPSQVNEKLVINKNYKDINNIEDFLSSKKLVYIKLLKTVSSVPPRLIIDIKKIKHVNDYYINDTKITMSYGDGIIYGDEYNDLMFNSQKNNLSLLRYNYSKRHPIWLTSITLFINPSVNDKVKSMMKIIHTNNDKSECKDVLIDFMKYVVEDENEQNTIIDFIGEKIRTVDIKDKYYYDRLMSNI